MVLYGSYIEHPGVVIAMSSERRVSIGDESTSQSLMVLSSEQVTSSLELLWAQSMP